MPGALIIESMAQSAGTLVMHSLRKLKNMSVYLLTVDKANLESQSVQVIHFIIKFKKTKY